MEDYERLKENLEQFDILGMLTAEVEKSRVNLPVVRRLVAAVAVLDQPIKEAAARTLVDNLEVLAPALPVVLRVLDELMPTLGATQQAAIAQSLRARIRDGEYFLTIPINLGYAVRVLRHDRSEENVALLAELYEASPPFIQRDIVYIMYSWDADYWLSDKRRQWATQHAWVRRALLLASYALGDKGSHWRRAIGSQLVGFNTVAREWMQERVRQDQRTLPL